MRWAWDHSHYAVQKSRSPIILNIDSQRPHQLSMLVPLKVKRLQRYGKAL